MGCYRRAAVAAPTDQVVCLDGSGSGKIRSRRRLEPIAHHSAIVHRAEDAAWYGGHIELFKSGIVSGPVHILDVTSAYPAVMRDQLFPVEYLHSTSTCTPDELSVLIRDHGAAAVVRIRSEIETYPVRHRGYVVLATGDYWTVLCGPELARAVESGHVADVAEVYLYRLGRPFVKVTEQLMRYRSKSSRLPIEIRKEAYKRLATALYGKFGQKERYWELVPGRVAPQPWHTWSESEVDTGRTTLYRSIGTQVQRELRGDWTAWACPIVCAYTTAYLREQMRRYIEVAGYRQTYFRAIDCIHVSEKGFQRLKKEGKIGRGRPGELTEKKTAQECRYYSHSWWEIDDDRYCPGVPPEAYGTTDGGYLVEYWPSGDRILAEGPEGPIRTTSRVIYPQGLYHGGIVGPDSWITPLRLSESLDRGRACLSLLWPSTEADGAEQLPESVEGQVE